VGLTIALAVLGGLALLLLLFAGQVESQMFHDMPLALLRMLDWIAIVVLLMLSFALAYRFAPNLGDAKWKWSTPGSVCALGLWILATFALRFYFTHISNYHRTYGHLNTVVMLLLWLYFTNAAILVGGEMNSEIEKAVAQQEGKQRSQAT
jgi:membrane protein